MNNRCTIYCLSALLLTNVVSCETHLLKVVDAETRSPLMNAGVQAKLGQAVSQTVFTNQDGLVAEPSVAGAASQLVVSKSGYVTKTVDLR